MLPTLAVIGIALILGQPVVVDACMIHMMVVGYEFIKSFCVQWVLVPVEHPFKQSASEG